MSTSIASALITTTLVGLIGSTVTYYFITDNDLSLTARRCITVLAGTGCFLASGVILTLNSTVSNIVD